MQKVYNIDLNDEACELNRKKKAAGTKMNALQGFGPHPNIRRASLRPEKSNFDRELGVCLCAFYCSSTMIVLNKDHIFLSYLETSHKKQILLII